MRLKQLLLCGMMWMCCVPLGAQTSKEEMFSTIEKQVESIGPIHLILHRKPGLPKDINHST